MKTLVLLCVGVLGLSACSDSLTPSTPRPPAGQSLLTANVGKLTQEDVLAIESVVQPIERTIVNEGIAAGGLAIRAALATHYTQPYGKMLSILLADRILDATGHVSNLTEADQRVVNDAAKAMLATPGIRSTRLNEFVAQQRQVVDRDMFEEAARILVANANAAPAPRPCTGCAPEQARLHQQTQSRFDASIAALKAAL